MKKIFLIIFMIFIFIGVCFSIPKPKDGKGSIIGKTYIELDKDWEEMRAGKYYKVKVIMFSKSTKKKYEVLANSDGIFYFFNLPPGEYILAYSRYQYNAHNTTYTLTGSFGKGGISVNINSNKIIALETIAVKKELLPRDESRDNVTSLSKIQRMNQQVVREDNILELKAFFKKIDRRNQWDTIEWE